MADSPVRGAGWTVGAIGLALGVAGPLLLYPKAGLGPLLGILMTGPLGFVLGVIGGPLCEHPSDYPRRLSAMQRFHAS